MQQQQRRFPRSRLTIVLLALVVLLFIALYLLSRNPGRQVPQFGKIPLEKGRPQNFT
jgi:hypothetical protein